VDDQMQIRVLTMTPRRKLLYSLHHPDGGTWEARASVVYDYA
jgi:hypothetical protein